MEAERALLYHLGGGCQVPLGAVARVEGERLVLRAAVLAPQLARCRTVDYRIKGYRPHQSRLGVNTDERRLACFNFEWLASAGGDAGHCSATLTQPCVVAADCSAGESCIVTGGAFTLQYRIERLP